MGCAIAAGYILNALAPVPAADAAAVTTWIGAHLADYTAQSQSVIDYIAANAGTSVEDAIKAVATIDAVGALTPAVRTWEALALTIPGLGTLCTSTLPSLSARC